MSIATPSQSSVSVRRSATESVIYSSGDLFVRRSDGQIDEKSRAHRRRCTCARSPWPRRTSRSRCLSAWWSAPCLRAPPDVDGTTSAFDVVTQEIAGGTVGSRENRKACGFRLRQHHAKAILESWKNEDVALAIE